MALSGSFSGSICDGHYKARVDWSATQNVANNTSTITCKLYLVNDYKISISSRTHTVTIAGTSFSLSSSAISTKGEHYIGSCSKTVTHNSDGTLTGVALSANFSFKATITDYGYFASIPASTTVNLDTIPRASTVSTTASNILIGDTISLTIKRASTDFTHTLEYAFGDTNGTIGTGLTTSKSWAIPMSLLYQIPNSISGLCVITCTTYKGSTKIGSSFLELTLTAPETIIPTATVSISEAVTTVKNAFGVYVKGLSKLAISVNATGTYGSTIKSYKITANGATYNTSSATTELLTTAGSMTITISAIDSRGRGVYKTEKITVVSYTNPYITTFSVVRCNSSGVETDDGTYIKATIKAGVSAISSNTGVYKLLYKKSSDASYTDLKTISASAVSVDTSTTITSVYFDPDLSYDFRLDVTDAINSPGTEYATIGTAFTLVDYYSDGTGMAIGKVAEKPGVLEMGIPIDMSAEKITNLATPTSNTDAVTKKYADDIFTNAVNYANTIGNNANTYTDGKFGYFRLNNGWLGMYANADNALSNTSRKGWLGYDNGNVFKVYDETGGVELISKSGALYLYPYYSSNSSRGVVVAKDRFRVMGDNVFYLGDTSNRWISVFAATGTIQTSDRNQKKDIAVLDQKYVDLFDKLQPVTFMFDNERSDRVHIGFISQDVKKAMDEVGLSDLDFAGYCRDIKTEWDEETQTDKPVLDENGEPVYLYSLRYSEFIALNTRMIQECRETIATQQTKIETLKNEVEELKRLVNSLVVKEETA